MIQQAIQQALQTIIQLFWCCGLIIAIGGFALWVWALVHALQNRALTDSDRTTWVVVIVLGGAVGAVIYLIVVAMKRE